MNILLIDCAFKKVEFAYNKKGNFIILNVLKPGENADSLVYEIRKAFDASGLDFSEIDCVGLSNGPGSFTGIRIGSAVAKGICYAGKAKLVELVTIDIVAGKFKENAGGKTVKPLIYTYSNGNDYYTADYIQSGNEIERISDYSIIKSADLESGKLYLINEKPGKDLPEGLQVRDLSGIAGADSMYALTLKAAEEGRFSDYRKSEPFYMKEMLFRKN